MASDQKHPGLTNEEFQEVGNYVRACADEMALRDWTFNIMYSLPGDEHALATIEFTVGRKNADVWLCRDFRHYGEDVQRHTICHELVHCHFQGMDALCRSDNFKAHVGAMYYHAFTLGMDVARETAVDGIADGWAKNLPMIDWPQDAKSKAK